MPLQIDHQPAMATLAVTTAAVSLSVVVTQSTMWLAGYDPGFLPAVVAGAIPALMVPFTVYPMARANRDMRLARRLSPRVRGRSDRT